MSILNYTTDYNKTARPEFQLAYITINDSEVINGSLKPSGRQVWANIPSYVPDKGAVKVLLAGDDMLCFHIVNTGTESLKDFVISDKATGGIVLDAEDFRVGPFISKNLFVPFEAVEPNLGTVFEISCTGSVTGVRVHAEKRVLPDVQRMKVAKLEYEMLVEDIEEGILYELADENGAPQDVVLKAGTHSLTHIIHNEGDTVLTNVVITSTLSPNSLTLPEDVAPGETVAISENFELAKGEKLRFEGSSNGRFILADWEGMEDTMTRIIGAYKVGFVSGS